MFASLRMPNPRASAVRITYRESCSLLSVKNRLRNRVVVSSAVVHLRSEYMSSLYTCIKIGRLLLANNMRLLAEVASTCKQHVLDKRKNGELKADCQSQQHLLFLFLCNKRQIVFNQNATFFWSDFSQDCLLIFLKQIVSCVALKFLKCFQALVKFSSWIKIIPPS